MKISKSALALGLLTALALPGCNEDEDQKQKNTQTVQKSEQKTEGIAPPPSHLRPEFLISVSDIAVTRNGADFTIDTTAYCNALTGSKNYEQDCSAAATEEMQNRFLCYHFPLAAGTLRSDNQDIIEAGLQGRYKTFPAELLYTQEKLADRLTHEVRAVNKDNYIIINEISDLETAAAPYSMQDPLPEGCEP